MKGNLTKCLFGILLLGVCPSAMAEDGDDAKVSFEVGADVVSSYVWRGIDCGGFSVQPGATVTWTRPGISFGAWASATLFDKTQFANMAEFDLALSYNPTDALTIGLTDYNFCGGKYFGDWDFSASSSHNLELNLGYDFGAVAVSWNTCLTGWDYNEDGDRAYSTYVEATVPFELGGVGCSAAVGVCPWGYHFTVDEGDSFSVMNVSLKAEKDVKGIPFFGQIVVNPRAESTYFVVGVSF